jgi:O-antigen ligase
MSSSGTRRQWSERLRLALLAMLYAIPLTVTWTVAGVHIAIGCGAVFAVAHGILARRWPLRRTPADAAWIAWALTSLLATLCAIPEAHSWHPMKKILLIPLAHVAAFALGGTRTRRALRLLVAATAVTALAAMLVFWLGERPANGRLAAWSHYMTFSGQILLVLPAAACAAWKTRGRTRGWYAIAVAVLALALALTFTRSAWLGVIAAFVMVLLRRRSRWLWGLPVVILLLFFVAPERYRERALSSFDPTHPMNQERVQLWKTGLEIWRDHPWTGVGLGDLIPVNRLYVDPGVEVVHGHLHSNLIQVLATRGILGVAAFVWLQVGFAILLWRARASDTETAALLLGVWGSFWGFQLMGLFEWNFGDVEVMIPLYFLLGAAAAQQRNGTSPAAPLFQGTTSPRRQETRGGT